MISGASAISFTPAVAREVWAACGSWLQPARAAATARAIRDGLNRFMVLEKKVVKREVETVRPQAMRRRAL